MLREDFNKELFEVTFPVIVDAARNTKEAKKKNKRALCTSLSNNKLTIF